MKEANDDICKCGDYRRQHAGGAGRCMLADLCQPAPCLTFRLFRPATAGSTAATTSTAQENDDAK